MMKRSLPITLAALIFALAVLLCHRLLQQETVYHVFSSVVKTYQRVDHPDGLREVLRVAKPYTQPSDSGMLAMDAAHYDEIRQHLYILDKSWKGVFAFYPLFPLVWRLLQLSPIGIAVFNWMLYAIGLALVSLIFGNGLPRWSWLLLLCAPYAVIFMIPYSEALFFLGIASGMVGWVRNRYWLYFLGFFVAAATRSAGNIMLVAWMIVDLLAALASRSSVKDALLRLLRHLAPILLGVGAVMVFQRLRGAEHAFEYVLAQQEWGKSFSWPSWPFSDWSDEGKSVSQPLIFMLFIPALVWLFLQLWRSVKSPVQMTQRDELRLFSVLFFVGNVLLALLTQHGCLYSQARLLTCTPFFSFLLIDLSTATKSNAWRWGMLAAMVVAACLCIGMFSKSYMFGIWIVFQLAVLVFFGDRMRACFRNTLLCITLLGNVFWTAYLFNCFLNNGWIFT